MARPFAGKITVPTVVDEVGVREYVAPLQTSTFTVAVSAADRHSATSAGNHSGAVVIAHGAPLSFAEHQWQYP